MDQEELQSIQADRGELVLQPIFKPKHKKKTEDSLEDAKRHIKKFESDLRQAEYKTQVSPRGKTLMQIINDDGMDGQEQEDMHNTIEDARRTKFYFKKLQMVEGGSFVFALISIMLSVIEYDMRFHHYKESFITTLLVLITLSTFVLVVLTVIRYQVELVLLQEQKIIHQRIYSLIMELLIIIPHPNLAFRGITIPSQDLYDQLIIHYEFNDFLEIYILLRTYILFRVLLNTTDYASTRATRICRMYGCEPGYFYSTKCLMNETPLKTVTLLFIMSILLGGQAIRICEEPLTLLTPGDPKDFGIYLNCFWCMIITMTTVGYGDYFARTIPGRFVTLIAAIVGVFLVSIMVVALTNTLNMNSAESKAHNVINRLSVRNDLMDQAANLLTSAAKFSLDNKKGMINKENVKLRLSNIKQHADRFRSANRTLKSMFDNSNLSEEMARHFDHLKDDLREIYENQIMLRDYLLKLKKHSTINEQEDEHFQKFNLKI